MERAPEDSLDVHGLIQAQRMLAESKHPYVQVVGTLWVAGTLKERLARLADRQVGQLLWDHVLGELTLFGPDATICEHAVRRLFRSAGGCWRDQDTSVVDDAMPPCPLCGAETIYHIGIDEPDFLLCVRADCEHKEQLGICADDEDD